MIFEDIGLGKQVLSAVKDLGFETPTPIQEQAIPYLLEKETDLIALAQTGTGKTAAFGLPIIHLSNPESRWIQCLILCPTRELCLQIADDMRNYAKYLPEVKVVPVYGGANIAQQISSINRGATIVVGTPGRTLDLIRRGDLRIDDIDWLVLDEADEMLDRGFKHDLDAILKETPRNKQTLLFSATMPDEIARIAREYLYEPKRISVGKLNAGATNVEHHFYVVSPKERYKNLKSLLRMQDDMYGIVFCRTKRKTREVARRLKRDGYKAGALEGDMSQPQRDKVMNGFRKQRIKILVATDVAARGVDVSDLSHVINFNIPDEDAVYIHRSGRTGRAGNHGVSISLLGDDELNRVSGLEKLARKSFVRMDFADKMQKNERSGKQEKVNIESRQERREPKAEKKKEAVRNNPEKVSNPEVAPEMKKAPAQPKLPALTEKEYVNQVIRMLKMIEKGDPSVTFGSDFYLVADYLDTLTWDDLTRVFTQFIAQHMPEERLRELLADQKSKSPKSPSRGGNHGSGNRRNKQRGQRNRQG